MSSSQKDPNIILLKEVRLSYPQVFQPKAAKNSDKKFYSASFLLDCKKHADTIKLIEATIERVTLDEFKKKVFLKNRCLRDGNEKQDKEGYGDGIMFVNSRSAASQPPSLVNKFYEPITDERMLYGGCIVHASVRLYAYDFEGSKGVAAGLRSIMFVRDEQSFGAGPINPEDEFGDVEPPQAKGKASTNPNDF
jgi:hypothetical protein